MQRQFTANNWLVIYCWLQSTVYAILIDRFSQIKELRGQSLNLKLKYRFIYIIYMRYICILRLYIYIYISHKHQYSSKFHVCFKCGRNSYVETFRVGGTVPFSFTALQMSLVKPRRCMFKSGWKFWILQGIKENSFIYFFRLVEN